MGEEVQQFAVTVTFLVENTSLERAQEEVHAFVEERLRGYQSEVEPIDVEFREVGGDRGYH